MKNATRWASLVVSVLSVFVPACAAAPASGPASAPAMTTAPATQPSLEALDPFTGEYEGLFTPASGAARPAKAAVYAWRGGTWNVAATFAAADEKTSPLALALSGAPADGKLTVAATADDVEWTGTLEGGRLVLASSAGRAEMKKVFRKSPTEGLKPPAGAVVLLAQTAGEPALDAWTNPAWKALPGGVMEVGTGDTRTLAAFGSCRLHVEFMIPYEPAGRGQGRGNSGVYLQDRYEVQVLDSFGLKMGRGDCGVIYQVAVPEVNVCLPPLSWQTFDITFHAARFGPDGQVVRLPRMTIAHNGVVTLKDVELPKPTGGAADNRTVPAGPIRLQDHQHPVRFRNIWLVELDDEDSADPPAEQ